MHARCSMPGAFQEEVVTGAQTWRARAMQGLQEARKAVEEAPRRRGQDGGGAGSGGSPEFAGDVDLRRKIDGHRWDGTNQRGGKRRRGSEERGGYQELTGGHGGGRGSRWRPESKKNGDARGGETTTR
jgi:hypothetical protein